MEDALEDVVLHDTFIGAWASGRKGALNRTSAWYSNTPRSIDFFAEQPSLSGAWRLNALDYFCGLVKPCVMPMVPELQEAMAAVKRGDLSHLRRLVQMQPDLLRAVDEEDHPSTLLHAAAASEHEAVVSALLELGAEVDAMTWATPLSLAASYGRTRNAWILLDAGGAFDARTNLGTTPLATAVLHGHPEVADLLAARGIVPRTLWVAAGAGELTLVKSFLRPDGTLAQGAAAYREDPHEYGMPSRARSDEPTEIIEEAFKYACANARRDVAQYFIDVGVDIDSEPHVGTPLHWAAYSGHLDMVRFLVDRGADVSARDDEWQGTPESWAARRGHEAVVDYLRGYDA